MSIVVTFHGDALMALLRGPSGPVVLDLGQRANRILNAARQGCPVDQGTLRASLHTEAVTVDGDPAYRIGSPLPYAIFVHEGTGIYGKGAPITPKSATVLRWPMKNNAYKSTGGNRRYSGGATAGYVFAKSSRGSPGRPFLLNALDAGR